MALAYKIGVKKVDLKNLFETQKVLRNRIAYNNPDRFDKLVVAFLVELGECANEWRGFKFWSKNQKPRTVSVELRGEYKKKNIIHGFTKGGARRLIVDDEEIHWSKLDDFYEIKNPLLEEYVDGIHFILELCIDLDLDAKQLEMFIDGQRKVIGSIEGQFGYIYHNAAGLMTDGPHEEKALNMLYVANAYIGLGYRLGFTWEQIESAYYEKNQINHERQENGY